jgi:hypothetical protein
MHTQPTEQQRRVDPLVVIMFEPYVTRVPHMAPLSSAATSLSHMPARLYTWHAHAVPALTPTASTGWPTTSQQRSTDMPMAQESEKTPG